MYGVRRLMFAGTLALACGRVGFDGAQHTGDAGPLGDPDGAVDATCTTVRATIADSADDGELFTTYYWPEGEQPSGMEIPWALYLGRWGGYPTWAYFRFSLPPGRVTSAHLELWAEGTAGAWDSSSHALRIVAEATSNAPVVTMADEQPRGAQGRPVTTAIVRWPATGGLAWPLGTRVISPELRPLFDEIGVLPPGAFVQLWLEGDFADSTNAEVGTPDSSVDAAHAAELVATVCP